MSTETVDRKGQRNVSTESIDRKGRPKGTTERVDGKKDNILIGLRGREDTDYFTEMLLTDLVKMRSA